jgi:hypothetical protein
LLPRRLFNSALTCVGNILYSVAHKGVEF